MTSSSPRIHSCVSWPPQSWRPRSRHVVDGNVPTGRGVPAAKNPRRRTRRRGKTRCSSSRACSSERVADVGRAQAEHAAMWFGATVNSRLSFSFMVCCPCCGCCFCCMLIIIIIVSGRPLSHPKRPSASSYPACVCFFIDVSIAIFALYRFWRACDARSCEAPRCCPGTRG